MDFIEEFDHQLAGIAWSLWRELGVAGIDRFHENCLVQPEELLILTAMISKYDPRLRDEALDWSSRYHEYISVCRLRALLKELGADVEHSFSQFAAALNSISSAKWLNIKELPRFKVNVSGKSLLPPLEAPSLLVLRLRSLFGPGAKADLLAHCLTRNEKHFSAADLVEIGYSKRSLITAFDHLAASGVFTVANIRNKKSYELEKPKELQVVIGKLPKIAPPWNKIVKVIAKVRSVIPELQNSSEMTKTVLFRNCLTKLEPLLPAFISPVLSSTPDFRRDWKAVIEMLNAFHSGNFFMKFEVVDEFEIIVGNLMQFFYQLEDCIDGIERIFDVMQYESNRHVEVYKECYQLFLSFMNDLKVCLNQFLDFPFHRMLDETLTDIPYRFAKNQYPDLLKKMEQVKPIDQISNVQLAVREYQLFMPELHLLRQFLYSFSKQLKELYFTKTEAYLLTCPTTLHKRRPVLALFPIKTEN